MLSLEELDKNNYEEISKLKISKEQKYCQGRQCKLAEGKYLFKNI